MGKPPTGDYRVRVYTDQKPVRGQEWYYNTLGTAIHEARQFSTDGHNKHRFGTHTGQSVVVAEERASHGEWSTAEEFPITPIQRRKS